MFKKKKHNPQLTDTLIGQGTEFEGHILCESSIRIEGKFKGTIDVLGDVVIGEHGVAQSNITAKDVYIVGKVIGDITTKGKLTIANKGHLTGNYTGPSIVIQEGAAFNGISQMGKNDTPEVKPEKPQQESNNKHQKKQAG